MMDKKPGMRQLQTPHNFRREIVSRFVWFFPGTRLFCLFSCFEIARPTSRAIAHIIGIFKQKVMLETGSNAAQAHSMISCDLPVDLGLISYGGLNSVQLCNLEQVRDASLVHSARMHSNRRSSPDSGLRMNPNMRTRGPAMCIGTTPC